MSSSHPSNWRVRPVRFRPWNRPGRFQNLSHWKCLKEWWTKHISQRSSHRVDWRRSHAAVWFAAGLRMKNLSCDCMLIIRAYIIKLLVMLSQFLRVVSLDCPSCIMLYPRLYCWIAVPILSHQNVDGTFFAQVEIPWKFHGLEITETVITTVISVKFQKVISINIPQPYLFPYHNSQFFHCISIIK